MADEQTPAKGNENPAATTTTTSTTPENVTISPYMPKSDEVAKQADNPDAVKNALNAERKAAREAAKRAEAAEARVREYEDASASEVEKLTKRAERAEQRAEEAQKVLLRFEVATQKKVPPELTPLLTGSTKDELESQATLLLENLNTAQTNFDGGVRETAPESADPADGHRKLLLRAFGRDLQP